MRILHISKDGLAGDLARRMSGSGHDVKYYTEDDRKLDIFDNIIEKIYDWRQELGWVGKDGLILFDDNGFGEVQEDLRNKGYSVFGGNTMADKLEYDREFTNKIFNRYGILTNHLKSFKDFKSAVEYVKKNPAPYTIKREGRNSKFVTFVGEHKDGLDVIEMLENYYRDPRLKSEPISIQKKAVGVEVGVARYFNGKKWVGPIEINVEHPHLFAGNIGPLTEEMGTVAWYTENENRLYKETLKKLEPFLKEIDYRGDIGINTIIEGNKIYALETTARLGMPIIHLQTALHISDWADFFKAIADGKDYKLNYQKGYGVVVCLLVPPFPFQKHFMTDVCSGLTIDTNKLTKKDWKNVHLDEVMFDKEKKVFRISEQTDGFIMYVTGVDEKSIKKARDKALNIAKKIRIPKMFYRIDIGEKLEKKDLKILKKNNWI